MKVAITFLIVGWVILGLLLCLSDVRFTKSTVDVHVHDTFVVTSYFTFAMVVFLFSITVFSLGGVIGTGFRNKYFLMSLLAALALNGWSYWHFISAINKGG